MAAPLIVIMSVVSGVSEAVVMPAIHRAKNNNCEAALRWQVVKRSTGIVIPVSLMVIFATWLVSDSLDIILLCILAPLPFLATLSAIYIGLLNAEGRFKSAVLGPFYGCILSIPFLFVLPNSARSLAGILLLFEVGRTVGLWFNLPHFTKMRGRDNSQALNGVLSWTIRGAKFQALGSLMAALNPMVDIFFAKTLESGAISNVEYANRLWNIVPLFFSGVLILLYSEWSKAVPGRAKNFEIVRQKARQLGGVAAILSLITVLLSPSIIDYMYGFGAMSDENREILGWLLAAYLLGASPFVYSLVYVRAFSVEGDMHIIAAAASASVICNIIANFILIELFGVIGIGLATSITYTFVAVLLYKIFHARYRDKSPY